MNQASSGFIVVDIESPWEKIAVPSHDVEGMVIQDMAADPIPRFDAHFVLAALDDRLQLLRRADIPLGEGRKFGQLTELI